MINTIKLEKKTVLKISICDDERDICEELECILEKVLQGLNTKAEIDVFFTGQELCRKMDAGAHYDLLFLDITFDKNDINGVEVGHLIRNAHNNNTVSIIYISWESNYAMQLFKIRPLDFLIKPLSYDKIEQVIKTHLKITGLSARQFIYKKNHSTIKAQINDILYLESRGRKVIIHFIEDKEVEIYATLKELYEAQLRFFDFLFIHASFAVNYDYISELKYNQLHIAAKAASLPISRNRQKEVRERYLAIIKRRGVS